MSQRGKKLLKVARGLHKHMEHYNNMAPFPVFDTEYVEIVKRFINDMEDYTKTDYDMLPVAACKHCKSLHIAVDDAENDYCMRCGSVNEIVLFETIHTYLRHINGE